MQIIFARSTIHLTVVKVYLEVLGDLLVKIYATNLDPVLFYAEGTL